MAIDHCPRYYFIFYFISWNPSDGWLLIKNNGGSSSIQEKPPPAF